MPVNYSALAVARHGDASSFEMRRRLASEVGAAALEALALLGHEMLLVGRDSRIVHAGEPARRIPPALSLRAGRLAVEGEFDTRRLQSAIARLFERPPGPFERVRIAGAVDLLLARLADSPLAIVLVAQAPCATDDGPPCVLTDAETRLLRALVHGERLAAYAERSGIKLTTAKTHLQALFGKSGQRRQSDLIRWALSRPDLQPILGRG